MAQSTAEMIAYYKELTEEFPIVSSKMDSGRWTGRGWKELTRALGQEIQLVGTIFLSRIQSG